MFTLNSYFAATRDGDLTRGAAAQRSASVRSIDAHFVCVYVKFLHSCSYLFYVILRTSRLCFSIQLSSFLNNRTFSCRYGSFESHNWRSSYEWHFIWNNTRWPHHCSSDCSRVEWEISVKSWGKGPRDYSSSLSLLTIVLSCSYVRNIIPFRPFCVVKHALLIRRWPNYQRKAKIFWAILCS